MKYVYVSYFLIVISFIANWLHHLLLDDNELFHLPSGKAWAVIFIGVVVMFIVSGLLYVGSEEIIYLILSEGSVAFLLIGANLWSMYFRQRKAGRKGAD